MQVTLNFWAWEFDCHDGTAVPAALIESGLRPLCETLELIRAEWGGSLVIVSGYRTPSWNKRIGGAPSSRHLLADAADVKPLEATVARVAELHAMILRMRLGRDLLPRLGGLGRYPRWVHVDLRPGGRLRRWAGKGYGAERVA